jgi:hypothetical protein
MFGGLGSEMSWEEHQKRLAAFPDDIRQAHDHSSRHRVELAESRFCGCFYCCSVFPPERIEEWTDPVDGEGQTALCPKCGIDAVIGDRAGFPISGEFLKRMRSYWF